MALGLDDASAFELDAGGSTARGDNPFHGRVGFQRDPEPACFGRHRLRNGAHAADGVAPDAGFSIYFAEYMVQQHIAAAGRVRARKLPTTASKPYSALTASVSNQWSNKSPALRVKNSWMSRCTAGAEFAEVASDLERAPQITQPA